MSSLEPALEEYLRVRRSLGVKLRETEVVLRQFVAFAQQEGAQRITTQLACRWACQPQGVHSAWWAKRLGMVRRFAQYLSAQEPRTEVPPQGLLPHRYPRPKPYLYTEEQIRELIQAARRLPSPTGLRPWTYATYLALLAVTGIRVGEAVHLDREDVDLSQSLITLRRTKLSKERLLPIHPSTCEALSRYQSQRDRIWPRPSMPRFFLSERGRPLSEGSARETFRKLSCQIGLRTPGQSQGPRLHDLRHRFAIRTLIGWYRSGADVEQLLPKLTTYLGHAHVHDTYWYFTAVPELLKWAAARLDEEELLS